MAAAQAGDLALADRIVAAVDDDVILLSDVHQVIELGLAEPQGGEDESNVERRVLDGLIDQKLRFHEIDRFGFTDVPASDVEEAYQSFLQKFSSDAAALRVIEDAGLDGKSVRRLFARQLMVLTYVDERLGARVFVSVDDIEKYYDEELAPTLQSSGAEMPPLADVREQIRALIREERLNREIERWTEALRAEADVVDYWDADASDLPPVVAASAEKSSDGE